MAYAAQGIAAGVFSKRGEIELEKARKADEIRKELSQLKEFTQKLTFQQRSQQLRDLRRIQALEEDYKLLVEQRNEQRQLRSDRIHSQKIRVMRQTSLKMQEKLSEMEFDRKRREKTGVKVSCELSPRNKNPKNEVKYVLVQRGLETMRLHILGEAPVIPKSKKPSFIAHTDKEETDTMTVRTMAEEDGETFEESLERAAGRRDRIKLYWNGRVKPDFLPPVSKSFFLTPQIHLQEISLRRKLTTIKRIPLRKLSQPPNHS